MNIGFRRIVILLALAIAQGRSNAQSDLGGPVNSFDTWRKQNLQEKIFVHTDKDQYLAGEIIWFKLHYVDASFHRPLQLSSIAYIELIDENNRPVLQSRVSLKETDASGSLEIPKTLANGYYRFRSYTRWMKNYSVDYFFEKVILIYNPANVLEDSVQPVVESYDVGIFPEGGDLVNGIESRIAIHITNQYGQGIQCRGWTINDPGDTLVQFETNKMGMGEFLLKPDPDKKYSVKFLLPNGNTLGKKIPPAHPTGVAMRVKENNEKIIVEIRTNEINPDSIFVFAHTRGNIRIAASVSILNGEGQVNFGKQILDEGISHITVFENRRAVCERLFFVYPRNHISVKADTDTSIYEIRDKIRIKIHTFGNDHAQNTLQLSMGIYRLDDIYESVSEQMNIQNYLLLNSDLTGYIQNSSWYFDPANPTKEKAMDLLMMTQGWRRFQWKDVLSLDKSALSFAPEFHGAILSARVTDKQSGLTKEDVPVYLSIPGKETKFYSSVSNAHGIADFELKDYFGKGEIVLQSPDVRSTLQFISPFSGNYTSRNFPGVNVPPKYFNSMIKKSIYGQVQEVYHRKNLDSFVTRVQPPPFYLKPDVVYILDRYTRFSSMEEVLREYVREVNVVNNGGTFHLHVMNQLNKGPFLTDPLILLDGLAVLDVNTFMNYDPLKVKSINVVTKKYYLGNTSFYGIIDCKTYKEDPNGISLDPKSVTINFDGLQEQREIYKPAYDNSKERESRMPDFRTLLYWNPSINTTVGQEIELECYSSDIPGKYVLIVQGISDDGTPLVSQSYFTVKKRVSALTKE